MQPLSNPSKPVVLHIVEAFGGGVGTFLRNLIAEPQMQEFDHVILHGLERSEDATRSDQSIRLIRWRSVTRRVSPVRDTWALVEAVRTIRQLAPAVIHCHASKGGALGRMAATLLGRRHTVVYTPHGVSFLRQDISSVKRTAFAVAERLLSSLGPNVIACSASEKAELAKHGISSTVIENAIPVRGQLDRGTDDHRPIRVVTVGRITRQKNPRSFASIAASLRHDPTVEFVWVGDGEDRDVLAKGGVAVTGWGSAEAVRRELADAHIYLSCSEWEGMPLAVLEAMEAGLPLVLSDCVGNRDLVDLANGFLYRSEDEARAYIKRLAEDPIARQAAGTASRLRAVRDHSLARQANEYAQLYRGLVDPSPSPRAS